MSYRGGAAAVLGVLVVAGMAWPAEKVDAEAVERGKKALLGRSFVPAAFTPEAYDNAWKHWGGLKQKPADYDRAFRDHYGLPEAPYANGKYPMGLREVKVLLGKRLATDCLTCHGGSILGKSYVGLPNSTVDYQALFEDLARLPWKFQFTTVRGTTEAAAMAVYLFSWRNADLTLRPEPLELGLHDDLCEDAPAWWLLKRKKTMYHTGSTDARSVRSLMQFMLSPLNGPGDITREEATFRDVRAYLLSLEAPKYPLPVAAERVKQGAVLFKDNCARCHGTYGDEPRYPNKIVPLDEIGTDPTRARGLSPEFVAHANASWFGQEKIPDSAEKSQGRETDGYQAPPLDGVWATAPYFHNGSVPTLYHVLNSKARPKVFTRSYKTEKEDYDSERGGWKFTEVKGRPDARLSGFERRKVYDTTQPGRGNGGHRYGDKLTEAERLALIEYLKTL